MSSDIGTNIAILKRYNVSCHTDGLVTTDFVRLPPTTCPLNSSHVIDPVTDSDIVETSAYNTVSIYQGGINIKYYKEKGYDIDITATSICTFNFETHYKLTPATFTFLPTSENIGDSFSMYVNTDTSIGTTTSAISINDTVIECNITDTNFQPGLCLAITDGTNKTLPITVLSISGTTITLEEPITFAFASGSQVLSYVPRIEKVPIVNSNNIYYGIDRLFADEISEGTTVRIIYYNNNSTAKKFYFKRSFKFGV